MQLRDRLNVTEQVNKEMQVAHRDQLARMSNELDEAERAQLREQEVSAGLRMELSAAAHAAELMSKERDEALELHKESRDLLIAMKADHDGMVAEVTGAKVIEASGPLPSAHLHVQAHRAAEAEAHAAHAAHTERLHAEAAHAAHMAQQQPPPSQVFNQAKNSAVAADRLRSIQERGQRILHNYRQH